jgi:DNA-binding beta-propeller fold protein YncE
MYAVPYLRIGLSCAVSEVLTVGGAGVFGYNGDGIPATAAFLGSPQDVTIDPTTGNLLVADTENNRVREIDSSTGIISSLASSESSSSIADTGNSTRHRHFR